MPWFGGARAGGVPWAELTLGALVLGSLVGGKQLPTDELLGLSHSSPCFLLPLAGVSLLSSSVLLNDTLRKCCCAGRTLLCWEMTLLLDFIKLPCLWR